MFLKPAVKLKLTTSAIFKCTTQRHSLRLQSLSNYPPIVQFQNFLITQTETL